MAPRDVDAKGLEVLAFDDWQAARAEASAIVGGIQLAAEPGRPAISASKWREITDEALEQRQIVAMPDVGNAERGTADLAEGSRPVNRTGYDESRGSSRPGSASSSALVRTPNRARISPDERPG